MSKNQVDETPIPNCYDLTFKLDGDEEPMTESSFDLTNQEASIIQDLLHSLWVAADLVCKGRDAVEPEETTVDAQIIILRQLVAEFTNDAIAWERAYREGEQLTKNMEANPNLGRVRPARRQGKGSPRRRGERLHS